MIRRLPLPNFSAHSLLAHSLLAHSLLAGSLLVWSMLAWAPAASALLCKVPPAPAEAIENVDVLFEGVAVPEGGPFGTDLREIESGPRMTGQTESQRFRVFTVYKGDVPPEVVVRLPGRPWAYTYDTGQTYVIAARRTSRGLTAGPCAMVEGGPEALRDWLLAR